MPLNVMSCALELRLVLLCWEGFAVKYVLQMIAESK